MNSNICIICARKNSKGIKNKNLLKLKNKNLLKLKNKSLFERL